MGESVNFPRVAVVAVVFASTALREVIIVRAFLMIAKERHDETRTFCILIFDVTREAARAIILHYSFPISIPFSRSLFLSLFLLSSSFSFFLSFPL